MLVLNRIREAWRVIAGWGRWCDENLGEWPSTKQCLASLPNRLAAALEREEAFEVENFLDTLHDRDWIWWSGHAFDDFIKLDIAVFSEPSSFWPLEYVARNSGSRLINKSDRIDLGSARLLANNITK